MQTNHPTPVAVPQEPPLAVEIWHTTTGHVIRALLGILAVLHTVTCIVFLYTVYTMYQALQSMQESLRQWGVMLGG